MHSCWSVKDAGCGMRSARIPRLALVMVAGCGLRNRAKLPFSASVYTTLLSAVGGGGITMMYSSVVHCRKQHF